MQGYSLQIWLKQWHWKTNKELQYGKSKTDVSKIPFSIRSTFDDSDEQLKAFNTLFLSVIAVHPFLKKVKTTRPE